MDRRTFLALSPAFPAATVTAALVLREDGHEPVELDIAVLKTQPGDILVITAPGPIREETAQRLIATVENQFPTLKAMVLGDGLKLDGVVRP